MNAAQPRRRLVAFAHVRCETGTPTDVPLENPVGEGATLGSVGRRTLEKGTIAVMVGSSEFPSSVDVREGCD
jgi:hypothetical protein